MEMKRKLWVTVTLASLFIMASFWLLTPGSSSKVSAAAGSSGDNQVRITLHVDGQQKGLLFEDAADLPEIREENINALGGFSKPIALAQADIDNDGYIDLLAVYATGGGSELRVRFGTPAGDFSLPQTYTLGAANPKAIAVGDFNVDGFRDVVISNPEAGTISLFYGNRDKTLRTGPTLPLGSYSSLASADINRDGLDDLIAVNEAGNNIHLIFGTGDLSRATVQVLAPRGAQRI